MHTILLDEWSPVSADFSAASSCSNVTVACSASSHVPPLVISVELGAPPSSSPDERFAEPTAGSPQKTAIRPEHELLVTCHGAPSCSSTRPTESDICQRHVRSLGGR